MGLGKQITVNAVYRILFLFVQLLNTILISRLTGPAGFGLYSLIIINANVFLIFTSMGIPSGIVYHSSLRDITTSTLLRIIWKSTLLQFILVLLIEFIHFALKGRFMIWPGTAPWMGGAGLLFFVAIVINEKYYALYNGNGKLTLYNKITVFFSALLCSILMVLFYLRVEDPVSQTIVVFIGVQVIQIITLAWVFHQGKNGTVQPEQMADRKKDLFNYSFFAFIANALHFLVTRVDFWILDYFKGEEALGIYALGVRIVQLFLILPTLLAGIILPSITSEEFHTEALEKILRILNSVNLLIIAFMFVTSTWLIPLIFGASFSASTIPLILLLPGMLFLSVQTLLASYFAGKGQLQVNVISTIFSLAAALTLDFILIPRWGAAGAAVASTVSYTIGCIFVYLRYCRIAGYPWKNLIINRDDVAWIIRTAKGYFNNPGIQ